MKTSGETFKLRSKVLFLNRSFYPDLEATGQLLTELCEDLSQDFEVYVVAGNSYYYKNSFTFLPIKREIYKEISIIRVNSTTFSKEKSFGRIVNFSSYFFYSLIAGLFVKPDLTVALTDPPIIGPIGLFFSKFYKVPFIFYCQDIYPDVPVIVGELRNPLIIWFLNKINQLCIRKAQKTVVEAPEVGRRFLVKGFNTKNIKVIHNWVDTSMVRPIKREGNPFRKKHDLQEKFVVMYSGNIGMCQNLEMLIEAAASLKPEKQIYFMIIGEGAKKRSLIKKAKDYSLDNIKFLPYQPKEKLSYSLSAGDVHVVPLMEGLVGFFPPSKVYGIMATGRPFIASGDQGSLTDYLVQKFNCGKIIQSGSVSKLAEAIIWSFQHQNELESMGKNGRKAAAVYFDRSIASAKWDRLLQEVLQG